MWIDVLTWLGNGYGAYRAAQDSGIWILEEQIHSLMDALRGIMEAPQRGDR